MSYTNETVILAAKKAVFNKGDKADSMYIIEFGHVEVVLDKPVKLKQRSGGKSKNNGQVSQETWTHLIIPHQEILL